MGREQKLADVRSEAPKASFRIARDPWAVNATSEPDGEHALEGVVLGVLGELAGIGQAQRGALADGEIESGLDQGGVACDRLAHHSEAARSGEGERRRRIDVAEGMAPGSPCQLLWSRYVRSGARP